MHVIMKENFLSSFHFFFFFALQSIMIILISCVTKSNLYEKLMLLSDISNEFVMVWVMEIDIMFQKYK